MEYNEKQKAIRKFEQKLIDFIKDYIKKYPTYDIIRKRSMDGECLCIDYRSLEMSIRNVSELEYATLRLYLSPYKYVLAHEMIFCATSDGHGGSVVKYEETDGIAAGAVEAFIDHNKIKDFNSLPAWLLPSAEEIAKEEAYKRKCMEEEERFLKEQERIKAEHAFRPGATPVVLVIPDVHGRPFWKDAVISHPSLPVIFLGDYVDPYYNHIEKITPPEALENLVSIMEYKHSNPGRVTLLFGNHDLHYFCDDISCRRKSEEYKADYLKIFTDNIGDFQIATAMRIAGRTFIFSHAGIVPGWLDLRLPGVDKNDPDEICRVLNSRLHDDETFIHTLVADASYYRWGPQMFGSPVWADVDDHEVQGACDFRKKDYPVALPGNVMQIFGHTQQEYNPVYRPGYCCLDCRRAFLVTDDGKVMELD